MCRYLRHKLTPIGELLVRLGKAIPGSKRNFCKGIEVKSTTQRIAMEEVQAIQYGLAEGARWW